MKLCQKNNYMHLYSIYQAEFLKHLGSKLFLPVSTEWCPSTSKSMFQAVPCLWLNTFQVRVILLTLSCQCEMCVPRFIYWEHGRQSLWAALYKGVQHWKAHSAFFSPVEMQVPHNKLCAIAACAHQTCTGGNGPGSTETDSEDALG